MLVSLRKTISLIVLVLIFTLVFATDQEIIIQIAEKYLNTPFLSATIHQTNLYKLNNKKLESSGKLYKQNTQYLFEYQKPYYQFVKLDEKQIVLYDSKMKAAHIVDGEKAFNPGIILNEIKKNNFKILKKGSILCAQLDNYNEQLSEISVTLNPKTEELSTFSYTDGMGNKVTIELTKQNFTKSGKKLDTINYPKDTKVFKQ